MFNGTDRLGGKSPEPQFTVYEPGHTYPEATQAQRDHIPIVPASPTRLLVADRPAVGPAPRAWRCCSRLLLGIPALLWGMLEARIPTCRRPRPTRPRVRHARGCAARSPPASACGCSRVSSLFSHMARLHPRYVEGFTPAVAAMLGIGVAWACQRTPIARSPACAWRSLAGSLAISVFYAERLLYGTPATWWIALPARSARSSWQRSHESPPLPPRRTALAGAGAGAGATTLTLVAILAVPVQRGRHGDRRRTSPTRATSARCPTAQQRPLSALPARAPGRRPL